MSKTAFAKGNQLFRENKLEEAIREYKASLNETAQYFAYENMGTAYEKLGDEKNAIDCYKKSINLYERAVRAKSFLAKNNVFVNLYAPKKSAAEISQSSLPFLKKNLPGKVSHLRTRLLNLGFVEKATEDLANLAENSEVGFERLRAAWELAVYYSNSKDQGSDEKALYWSEAAKKFPLLTKEDKDAIAIIEAECLQRLGKIDEAKESIQGRIATGTTADLILASSHYQVGIKNKIETINQIFTSDGLLPIKMLENSDGKLYDALSCQQKMTNNTENKNSKVSVIIPAYEAEETLNTTLRSLKEQTWTNIEVFVVDDCSPDATLDVAKAFAEKDSRFKVLSTPENSGPYVARNLALQQATGDFVTINDADDWSHPQKIAIQVQHLLENPGAVANMSTQARMTEDFSFYRRGNPGFYIQPNMSSLMFRRKKVFETMGYWDSVRFAADSEFTQRLKKHFGKEAVVSLLTPPMSFQRQTDGSLTGSSSFGYHGFKMGARKAYEEAHKQYHKKMNKKCYITFPLDERPFPAPKPMLPNSKHQPNTHYDVILVSDFRFPGGTSMSNAEEIKAQASMGLRTGIVQMSRYDMNPSRPFNPIFNNLIKNNDCELIVFGQEVTCDLLILRQPWVLEEYQAYVPKIQAKKIKVIVNQPPKLEYGNESKCVWNIERCADNLFKYFGNTADWHPIGPLVRKALVDYHESEIEKINISPLDWNNIINLDEWIRKSKPAPSTRIRICRHSRDHFLKWPNNEIDLFNAYPKSKDFNIYVLGGAESPREIIKNDLPKNWKVTEFGKCDPKKYLARYDIFVYFTHPDWVEAFGRSIFEAMAVGLPVILPPQYEPVFKEAAIYCEPNEVEKIAKELMASEDAYDQQVNIALEYIKENFSFEVHARRLEKEGVDFKTVFIAQSEH